MDRARRPLRAHWSLLLVGDRRFWTAIGMLVALTIVGTLGYAWIEGMSPLDALFMAVITLSTVGYGETQPLSDAGRWFTVGLIVFGVGAVFHAASAIAGFVIEGRVREVLGRKSMQLAIDRLEDHVIICGYGRLGRAVAKRLESTPVVVIDLDDTCQCDVENAGHYFLRGSALEEQILKTAGIDRARALIAATSSDPDNVFIALAARELAPAIQIHARAESSAGVHRLGLSGASQVVSPHSLAGERIANALLRPGVVEFLELADPGTGAEVALEEVLLADSSHADGLSLAELRKQGLGLSVIAIKRGDEPIRMHPSPDEILRAGDRVVAVGDRANLARLAEAARSD